MAANQAMLKEREISRRLLMAAIHPGGSTKLQILSASGLHRSTFERCMKQLRAEKLVYICNWISRTDELGERKPGTPFAVFAIGDKNDAKRPKPIPKKVVMAKWTENHYAELRVKRKAREGNSNMFDQLRAV